MQQSHACTGWWAQRGLGRQEMEGLRMTVADGRISGSGMDMVGVFTFEGRVADGRVTMQKLYFEKYTVRYTGQYDGDSRLWGTWHLFGDQGPWEIVLRQGEAEAEEVTVEEAQPTPHAA